MAAISGTVAAVGAGAVLGGIAASRSKKVKFDGVSSLDLNDPSQLEELLGGSSVLSSDQNAQIEELQQQIEGLEGRANETGVFGNFPAQAQINKLKDQIAQIKANPEGRQGGLIQEQFGGIQDLIGAGPGISDVRAGLNASRDLGRQLQELSASSGLPTGQDIGSARGITQQLFAPQQVQFQQQLEDARIQSNRQAAQLGRAGNDPILAAKLAQEAARGRERIGAAQGAATQQLALQLPQQRLNFATQRASLLSGLGDQALQARVGLLGLGSQLLGQERQFRINTADRLQKGKNVSGGGLGGAISGAIGGAGAGLSAVSAFGQSNALTKLIEAQTQQAQGGLSLGANAANPFAGGGGNPSFGVSQQFGMAPRPFF